MPIRSSWRTSTMEKFEDKPLQGRLTRWEGIGQDGLPRAVLVKREGSWIQNMDEALRKLARYEDMEERWYAP